MTDFNVVAKVDSVSNTNGVEEMESALKGVATQSNEMADAETAVSIMSTMQNKKHSCKAIVQRW